MRPLQSVSSAGVYTGTFYVLTVSPSDNNTHDPNHEFFALHEPGRVVVHERPMRNVPVLREF